MSKNYIKLQNQGSIIQNLMLLGEMKDSEGFSDEFGHFTKRAVAEIAVKSAMVTSAGKIGADIIALVNDGDVDETHNSVLQNAKQRMQILRALGLVATDYDAEIYAITDLGNRVLERTFPSKAGELPDYRILLEAFLGISTMSEVYEYNCDFGFDCYLGYEICYALAELDYMISVPDLPCITTYGVGSIGEYVKTVKVYRKKGQTIPKSHEHYPKTQQGKPLNQASNITRTINQILRVCGILERKPIGIENVNYYVCTERGKKFVREIKKRWKTLRFISTHRFRRLRLLDQKRICCIGYNNMLDRGGYKVESGSGVDGETVFSPYQMIPETNANWHLGKNLRHAPKSKESQVAVINSQICASVLRLKPIYRTQDEFDYFVKTHSTASSLIEEIRRAKTDKKNRLSVETELLARHRDSGKELFYPFVHSLFNAIGLKCLGEVARFDALIQYEGVDVPVEIKSFTETPVCNLKGVRQALENKILVYKRKDDLSYATLVVGYGLPKSTGEIQEFIDAARSELGVKIVVLDLSALVKMCMRVIWDQQSIELGKLLKGYGILEA